MPALLRNHASYSRPMVRPVGQRRSIAPPIPPPPPSTQSAGSGQVCSLTRGKTAENHTVPETTAGSWSGSGGVSKRSCAHAVDGTSAIAPRRAESVRAQSIVRRESDITVA